MASGRKSRCDGEATREAILAAAEVEFSKKGFALASVREICRRAGANVALANRYFGSKEKLYRLVAERLFGKLGKPMADLAAGSGGVKDRDEAIRIWVDDFLYMAMPTERAQKLCRGLFRHEVCAPTKFRAEFERDFGKPIYDSLWNLVASSEPDPIRRELIVSSIWSQVAIYALVDESWWKSFRPEGVTDVEWRGRICDFICERIKHFS